MSILSDKKKVIIALAVIGLILICGGTVLGGSLNSVPTMFSETKLPDGAQTLDSVDKADIHAIEMNLVNSNITIQMGKEYTVSSTGLNASYVKDGTLYIGAAEATYAANIFGMKLKVPAKWVCGFGSYVLTIPKKAELDNIQITTTSSNITGDTLHTKNLDIAMKSGNLTIMDTAADTLNISTHGKVELHNIQIAQSGKISSWKDICIGDETSTENTLTNLTADTTFGDIALFGKLSGSSSLQTNFGDITTTLPGSQDNYGLTAQKGDLSISSMAGAETTTEHIGDVSYLSKHGKSTVEFY